MKRSIVSSLGFTIVELLIVVVVIAILASITVAAYNGVTGQANDVSVKNDLKELGQAVMLAEIQGSDFPTDEATLSAVGLKVAKGAYGNDIISGGQHYNLLYCSTVPTYSPPGFAFVAASKSGDVHVYTSQSGAVRDYPAEDWVGGGWGTICPDVLEVSAGNSGAGVWLYENSIWKIWLQ